MTDTPSFDDVVRQLAQALAAIFEELKQRLEEAKRRQKPGP